MVATMYGGYAQAALEVTPGFLSQRPPHFANASETHQGGHFEDAT